MNLYDVLNLLDILFWVMYMINVPRMLHVMQQESYQNDGMYRWIINNGKRAFKKGGIQLLATGLTYAITILLLGVLKPHVSSETFITLFSIRMLLIVIAFFVSNIFIISKDKEELKNAKKPLKYTARARRLCVYNFFVLAILHLFFGEMFGVMSINSWSLLYPHICNLTLLMSALIFTLPINMIIANWFASPMETAVNNHYINKARRKLRKKEYKDLIKIGITGSYGKTSTKFILKTILEEKYKVLATPGSYNTTMGNVRIIREELKPEHQVFISEMGARKRYDIQEICQFVEPQIGIITSIGPQHLETFKKIENVAKTKGELLKGVTSDGAVFLPKDNSHCLELYKNDKHKKFLYSTKKDGSDVYAKDIKVTKDGSTFTVVYEKEEFTCQTKLLGEHNVQNIIGCVAIAKYLGLTAKEIQRGIAKIEPVEHRLQLIPSQNGTTVIDDAFNSNPVGSKMALDIIKQFEGRKIIITPGMVELGEEEYKLNKEFGIQMAEAVDFAILVGRKRSEPIVEGLKSKKFNGMNLYVVNNLDEATAQLAKLTKPGDVILFENDLPDNYNEN